MSNGQAAPLSAVDAAEMPREALRETAPANAHRQSEPPTEQRPEPKPDTYGMVLCGLCGNLDIPVTHHGDCAICARDQYA